MTDDEAIATATGDQIQATLDSAGVEAVGFIVVLAGADGLTVESRSRVTEGEFWRIIVKAAGTHPIAGGQG